MNLSLGCDLGNLTVPLPFKIVSKKIPLIWGSNRKKPVHNLTVDNIFSVLHLQKIFLKILSTTDNYAESFCRDLEEHPGEKTGIITLTLFWGS